MEGEDLKLVEALLPQLEANAAEASAMGAKFTGGAPQPAAVKVQNVATDIDCDDCGKPMIVRQGRRGPFLGCSGYPKCKNTSEMPARLLEEMGINADGTLIAKAEINGDKEKPLKVDIETDLTLE